MIAGVFYSVSGSDNTMVSDPIDASKTWSILPGTAYEKSVDVTTTKTIVNGDGKTSDGTSINTGADAAKDDYVQFKIESTIPAYTSNYKNVTYTINDTLTGGLGVVINDTYKMTVTVAGQAVDAANNTYSYITGAVESADDPSQSLTIDFASNYILAHPGQKVVVTYYAKLYDVEGLATNMDANKNTANITYTNDPAIKEGGTTNTTTTPDSTTYHYTFEIDGDLSGIIEIEGNKETTELTKTGTETWTDKAKHITEKRPLEGAEFTLTNDATGKVYTTTTTEFGAMNFKGLDAGTYTLKETKAP